MNLQYFGRMLVPLRDMVKLLYWEVTISSKWSEDVDSWGWFWMILIIYDVQLGIRNWVETSDFVQIYKVVISWSLWNDRFPTLPRFQCQLTMSNHVSYSVLLSPFHFLMLALRGLVFDFRAGVGYVHQSKEIRRFFWYAAFRISAERPIAPSGFSLENPELWPATHAELFRGSPPFELVGSCRPCRSWTSLLSSQTPWHLPRGGSERLEPWSSSTWTFHGSNEADTLVGIIFLFQNIVGLMFLELINCFLFLLTLTFNIQIFLIYICARQVADAWDWSPTKTTQAGKFYEGG